MKHPRNIAQARAWWRDRVRAYGPLFFAEAPTPALVGRAHAPDPVKIEHTMSGVFRDGWRTWAFRDVVARDRFVETWEQAKVCDDPCP